MPAFLAPVIGFLTSTLVGQLIIGLALNIIAYLLAPKPKAAKPDAARDFEAPTAEAGRPVPVIFGDVTIKGANVLWYGDIRTKTHKIKA